MTNEKNEMLLSGSWETGEIDLSSLDMNKLRNVCIENGLKLGKIKCPRCEEHFVKIQNKWVCSNKTCNYEKVPGHDL